MVHLSKSITNFHKSNIVVIGDIILDEYLFGNISRINPEAPVPVLHIKEKEYRLGGAANVANNIVSLGGRCSLIGLAGQDKNLDRLTKELSNKKINHYLVTEKDYPTIIKTRIIAKNQQIIRIDKEKPKKLDNSKIEEILNFIKENNFNTILISDYDKGTITKKLVEEIKKLNIKIISDPKPKNISLFKDIFAISPNLKEAKEFTGKEEVEDIGKEITKKLNTNLILTRGKDGVSLFEKDNKQQYFPAKTKKVFDISGAGDTFIATTTLGISSGLSMHNSIFLGNHAAGIVVKKQGTATLSKEELMESLSNKIGKIKKLNNLKSIIKEEKNKGKKIVFTNGCFDILHVGHTRLLKEARELGDILILGINSDKSIKKLKGDSRPINNEDDRTEVLSSVDSIDHIVVFDEDTPLKLISELEPDVLVKGADYKESEVVGAELIKEKGGAVKLVKLVEGKSTTKIIDKSKNV